MLDWNEFNKLNKIEIELVWSKGSKPLTSMLNFKKTRVLVYNLSQQN
jgi:hypothetical protein